MSLLICTVSIDLLRNFTPIFTAKVVAIQSMKLFPACKPGLQYQTSTPAKPPSQCSMQHVQTSPKRSLSRGNQQETLTHHLMYHTQHPPINTQPNPNPSPRSPCTRTHNAASSHYQPSKYQFKHPVTHLKAEISTAVAASLHSVAGSRPDDLSSKGLSVLSPVPPTIPSTSSKSVSVSCRCNGGGSPAPR